MFNQGAVIAYLFITRQIAEFILILFLCNEFSIFYSFIKSV